MPRKFWRRKFRNFNYKKIFFWAILWSALLFAFVLWVKTSYTPEELGIIRPPAREGLRRVSMPKLELPQGKQSYLVQSQGQGPKITEIVVDPLDPELGEEQKVSVKVISEEKTQEVAVMVNTDTESNAYSLELIGGDFYHGIWQTSRVVEDTFEEIYDMRFVVAGEKRSSTLDFPIR